MEWVFKDSAIQIVTIKEDGDFEITVEGINFLSSLKNKKVIITFLILAGDCVTDRALQKWQVLPRKSFNEWNERI